MIRTFGLALAALTFAVGLGANTGGAAIAPPWCGTPEPDAAAALPDGSDPSHPAGSFPHIPYYAIGCTLDSIAARSGGRMSVETAGASALGREMFRVTINALDTNERRQAFQRWQEIRRLALTDPARAQALLADADGAVKVPIFIQGGIHGNEYEGVDAAMQLIEKLATTPAGADPEVDAILDHAVVVFNPTQNPDGRVAGTRANGNGFDLNRDYLTQSQSETLASTAIMHDWLPPEVLDLHGYATPTLIEATTKPHNPSIEYDLWLKWNQARIDANEAALNAVGLQVQRPINDWCSDANLPPASGICPDGDLPGPAEAEGWDDWGPFYTAMYAQHIGLDSSTVEMCQSVSQCGGRAGARTAQYVTSWSTLEYVVANREDMLHDELEIYRRAVTDAARPACCPAPFDVDNNWMTEYPRAYVIPRGEGQRSTPEASRLVQWLLDNQILVEELKQNATFEGQTFERGSYVVWMNQARRGLADTALSIGVDVSSRISILYAPPAAWSHGYLWGANVVTIPRGAAFSPLTNVITKPSHFGGGGLDPGPADRYALKIDSPTAVRTLNRLLADGASRGDRPRLVHDAGGRDVACRQRGLRRRPLHGDDAGRDRARRGAAVQARPDGEPAVARADRGRAPDRRARGGGRPERLDAPEPGLHRRPGLGRDDQLGADRSAARVRPRLQHRELALGRQSGREGQADRLLHARRRLPRGRRERRRLPHRRRAAHRPDRGLTRRQRKKWDHLVGERRWRGEPRRRRLPRPRHGDRRPTDLVHGGSGLAQRRCAAAADRLLRRRSLVTRRAVRVGAGLARDRARDEHHRHRAADRVRDEPALPSRSRAGMAGRGHVRLLG